MSKFMSILILVIICLFLIMTTQLRAQDSLTFFTDRAECDTACPNLPVEDFETTLHDDLVRGSLVIFGITSFAERRAAA